jgi:acyl carrier protein
LRAISKNIRINGIISFHIGIKINPPPPLPSGERDGVRGRKRRSMVEPTNNLIEKIKQLIITRLKLVDMTPEMIENNAPLFGEGLGLDSIDALELVLGLEKEFGVIIPDAEVGKKVFQSVRTMAQYVLEQQGKV